MLVLRVPAAMIDVSRKIISAIAALNKTLNLVFFTYVADFYGLEPLPSSDVTHKLVKLKTSSCANFLTMSSRGVI